VIGYIGEYTALSALSQSISVILQAFNIALLIIKKLNKRPLL